MALETHISGDGTILTIKLPRSFDLSISREFRLLDKSGEGKIKQYAIDFAACNHMDSSALGMLLLLREELGGDGADITLLNCSNTIRELLRLARFEDLFRVI